jgi:putative ferrous iron transport protein C
MLSQTKQLLRERGRLSLRELAVHFQMTPDAVQPMMAILVAKGQVREIRASGCGDSCGGCACTSQADMVVYELVTD